MRAALPFTRRVGAACCMAMLACALPARAAPSAGRYEALLCVATLPGAEPTCGPAEAEVRSESRLDVRISDVSYRLALRSSQLDVITLHGSVQIDEFSSPYEWAGNTLRFGDEAKAVRYEIRLGARRQAR